MDDARWPPTVWLRIALATSLFVATTYAVESSDLAKWAMKWAAIGTAFVVEVTLAWLGTGSQREFSTLVSPGGFGYQIDFACTGIIPAGFLGVAILASQSSFGARIRGTAIGVPCILLLNVIRLISLFYAGIWQPQAFEWVHSAVWQPLMVGSIVAFFLLWKHRMADGS